MPPSGCGSVQADLYRWICGCITVVMQVDYRSIADVLQMFGGSLGRSFSKRREPFILIMAPENDLLNCPETRRRCSITK